MEVSITGVKGLKELDNFLKTLPWELQTAMLRKALMSASKPILDKAKENVRAITERNSSGRAVGVLSAKNAIVRTRVKKTVQISRVDVKLRKKRGRHPKIMTSRSGVRVYKEYGDDPFYGRFLEFGRSGMAAQPWLKPAAVATNAESNRRFRATLTRQVKKYCKGHGIPFKPGT